MALSSEQIAEKVYGLDPADQARIAKDLGLVPDADGLIEFAAPIDHMTHPETGESIGVYDLIVVEDAPLADEDEIVAGTEESSEDGGVSTFAAWTPYWWVNSGGAIVQRFGMGRRRVLRPAGRSGIPMVSVMLEGGVTPYRGRTLYNTRPLAPDASNQRIWSPMRNSGVSTRIYRFSRTVYGDEADTWYR